MIGEIVETAGDEVGIGEVAQVETGEMIAKEAEDLEGAVEGAQTGAQSGEVQNADNAYEKIRTSKDDVKKIASHTGIKEKNIAKVKRHLFYEKHLLDRYESYGIPAKMQRFDSDAKIAESWKRLESGNYTKDDIRLIKHEAAESWYMRKYGPSYSKAHDAVNSKFPAPEWEDYK